MVKLSLSDVTLPHCSWTSLREAVYKYSVPRLAPFESEGKTFLMKESFGCEDWSPGCLHTKLTRYPVGSC